MKKKVWALVAFNVAGMLLVARAASFYLTAFLVMSLVLVNILILFVFRRKSLGKTDSSGQAVLVLDWTSWTVYIPIVGGAICILIGVVELAWRPCVIGLVAILVGGWRIWANRRVRRGLVAQERRNRRDVS